MIRSLKSVLVAAMALASAALVSAGPAFAAMTGEAPASLVISAPADEVQMATLWKLITPNCKAGEIRDGGCICPPGQTRQNSVCAPIAAPDSISDAKPDKPKKPKKPNKPKKPVSQPKAVTQPVSLPDGIAGSELGGKPCLDTDLFDLMTARYGKLKGLSACTAGCVPRPTLTMMPADELDKRARDYQTRWCPDSCIKVSGYMPADEVIKLEKTTGRKFCPVDGQMLCRVEDGGSVPVQKSVDRVLSLYTKGDMARDTGDGAVIIGISDYNAPLPVLAHARRDAAAVQAVLTEKLGFAKDGVSLKQDATLADLKAIFGPQGSLAKSRPTGALVIYIAAHGMSDATGTAYILPSDGDPARLSETALPLQTLYNDLGKLGAKSVTVILEASFPTSIGDLIDPPNLPTADVATMPTTPVAGLSVFTAADRDQQTLADPEFGTGLFTRYWLEGLAGAADASPIGNADATIESVELYVFTAHKVRVAARKSFGLEQKPQISEAQTAVVRRL